MYERYVRVVAEIGCNHKGDIEIAKRMIETAAQAGVDVVKFQKRNPKESLTEEQYNAPHPVPKNSYGTTYGEHREALEFSFTQHMVLKEWCEKHGVIYSSSVWDLTSAQEITELDPYIIKVPSACNLNFPMLDFLAHNFDGEIHVSLGMTTREEELRIAQFFIDHGRSRDVVLYACTSGYPVDFEDVHLLEVQRLWEDWSGHFKEIGFSGHHLGIAVDVAAMVLGATVIERHFTLDRTWKGTDHAASLEPHGLTKLVRDIKNVRKSLSYKGGMILDVEKPQRDKLKNKKQVVNL